MSKVFEKDNFLTQDECNLLIDYQKAHCANDIQNWSLQDHDSNWNSRIVVLDKIDDSIVRKLVEAVHYKISILCAKSYNVDYVYPEFSNLVYWAPGMSLGVHADNMWINDPKKSHYASHRDFSMVIYLNDNYEGGKTFFNDNGYKVQPKTGKLIYFTSGKEDAHGVTKVISGHRYTFALWFTKNKKRLFLTS
tara:strand:+ start:264 stop:839 length:576 start_codon:yes stop_codon:yes gene_type:complete